mmetsp:Transcript_28830/g.70305  ORF Transcript_28830/g.70305 Transcript_28830/m.70305 type:complete len:156 (-) Transcript_28830:104-571(-)
MKEDRKHVNFVEVDFMKESWIEKLINTAKMDKRAPTLLLWEGVTYYVSEKVVQETLKVVSTAFEGPAAIAFDYASAEYQKEMSGATQKIGEPWIFGLESKDMSKLLASTGLRELDHLSRADCLKRYFPVTRDGNTLGIGGTTKVYVMAANKKWPV